MVSRTADNAITHARFADLPSFLESGDVLVVNTSATINAALPAVRDRRGGDARKVLLHLSSPLDDRPRALSDRPSADRRTSEPRSDRRTDGLLHEAWVVELREASVNSGGPVRDAESGELLRLPAGAIARLVRPYAPDAAVARGVQVRLWVAELALPENVVAYAARHGSPIRYGYVPQPWPLSDYQTVFAEEPGSAEMPSAGRPFTHEIVMRLTATGIQVVPVTLHTGVSSLDTNEPPYPERFRVPAPTARAVNEARSRGSRVIGVGTTTVRALETVASLDGYVHGAQGWTDVVVTPARGIRVVTGMLTGFHAPGASHLAMLEAMMGRQHLVIAYQTALRHRYLWHEFGDVHLVLGVVPSWGAPRAGW